MEFREIVRKIHPDLNPGIDNASGKMNLCIRFKKDPKKLTQLALQWGLIPGSTPKPKPALVNVWSTGSVGTTKRPVTPSHNSVPSDTVFYQGEEGWHTNLKRWFKLNKSTAKMVYYWNATEQKSRKCSLKTMSFMRKKP